MSYRRYATYRDALEKRGHEPWRERLEWLSVVEDLERRMGAPMFSNTTKLEVASGISANEIKREMDRIYQHHFSLPTS